MKAHRIGAQGLTLIWVSHVLFHLWYKLHWTVIFKLGEFYLKTWKKFEKSEKLGSKLEQRDPNWCLQEPQSVSPGLLPLHPLGCHPPAFDNRSTRPEYYVTAEADFYHRCLPLFTVCAFMLLVYKFVVTNHYLDIDKGESKTTPNWSLDETK